MADKEYDLLTMEGRMAYAIDSKGQANVAREVGLSPTQVHRITKGYKTTLDNAIAIAQFTGFNLQWLAFGEGPQQTLASAGVTDADFVAVDSLRDGKAFPMTFHKSFLEELKIEQAACRGWKIDIESGLSRYPRGTDVLIHSGERTGNGAFVLRMAGTEIIANVEHKFDGSVSLQTDDNKTPEIISDDQFLALDIIGKIRWSLRSE